MDTHLQVSLSGRQTIVRTPEAQCWLYGVLLPPGVDLPPFPELKPEDLDILQPLPGDETLMTDGPFAGHRFVELATHRGFEQ